MQRLPREHVTVVIITQRGNSSGIDPANPLRLRNRTQARKKPPAKRPQNCRNSPKNSSFIHGCCGLFTASLKRIHCPFTGRTERMASGLLSSRHEGEDESGNAFEARSTTQFENPPPKAPAPDRFL